MAPSTRPRPIAAKRKVSRDRRASRLFARPRAESLGESGFTIVELVISLAILAVVAAPLAGVFWSAIRTAGSAAHRTDGSSIASREIEGLRAVPYGQVGFYDDQPRDVTTFEGLTTVSLGATSPSSGAVPLMQPETPDPSAAVGFAPDPNPANVSPIIQGGVKYSVTRNVVWVDAKDSTTTYAQAYKRLTVIVVWSDQAGHHVVRQDSVLYPGGLGTYQGAKGGPASTTTTAPAFPPSAPNVASISPLPSPADQSQVALSWTQPVSPSPVTSYSVEYSTSPAFPVGNFAIVGGLAPSITSYTVTGLTPSTTYYFKIVAYAGTQSATSSRQSISTAAAGPVCTLGGLNVTGTTSLSTTGTILQNNGKMSENLTLSWSTTGSCSDTYEVKAVDSTNTDDPSSPYVLGGSSGAYSAIVASFGSKSWAVGLHTFAIWDVSTNSSTSVVKTFTVCVNGSSSC
jgi:prepilin-type N-terminal cleavage/methylation domain-containing protein